MIARRASAVGYSLRDPALLAVARVEATSISSLTPWTRTDEAALRDEAARQLSGHAHAAAMLGSASARLVHGIELVPFLEPGGPFGPAWTGHPFASPAIRAGYKLREPDVTRQLASLMGSGGGRHASKRAVTFLRILSELAGAEPIRAVLTDQTRPVVEPEARASAAARIDLLFEWPTGIAGQRAVVVVEAKLGSSVGDDQLRPYRIEALRRAKGGPVALILLTPWVDAAERRYRAWKAVRWFPLLRRWESALAQAGDDDPEFARVRAHLWQFVMSSRRAHH